MNRPSKNGSEKNDEQPEVIDSAHLSAVLEGLAQAKQRQFASDDEVEAALRRFER